MPHFCPNCQSWQPSVVLMYSADQSWLICQRCSLLRITSAFQTFIPAGHTPGPAKPRPSGSANDKS